MGGGRFALISRVHIVIIIIIIITIIMKSTEVQTLGTI